MSRFFWPNGDRKPVGNLQGPCSERIESLSTPVRSRYDGRMSVENRVAYQEKLIAQLDEVVREFADRVKILERRALEHEASAEADVGPANDRPPHY
ncbi:MAG: putative coiled-coil protein SlyX [Myxococcota bacterium]|jgi:uncharacterized coiled-coil protein SlyX